MNEILETYPELRMITRPPLYPIPHLEYLSPLALPTPPHRYEAGLGRCLLCCRHARHIVHDPRRLSRSSI